MLYANVSLSVSSSLFAASEFLNPAEKAAAPIVCIRHRAIVVGAARVTRMPNL